MNKQEAILAMFAGEKATCTHNDFFKWMYWDDEAGCFYDDSGNHPEDWEDSSYDEWEIYIEPEMWELWQKDCGRDKPKESECVIIQFQSRADLSWVNVNDMEPFISDETYRYKKVKKCPKCRATMFLDTTGNWCCSFVGDQRQGIAGCDYFEERKPGSDIDMRSTDQQAKDNMDAKKDFKVGDIWVDASSGERHIITAVSEGEITEMVEWPTESEEFRRGYEKGIIDHRQGLINYMIGEMKK